ncbi:MAG: hypothetical protein HYX79_02325 [Chloroflexi bacterium]|nr:hypothetical protein [Chloroflexota bacterium]
MADIKSAAEIAAEKVREIGTATEEERLSWKYVPDGERLAARYLKGEADLAAELRTYDDKARKYVAKGAQDVLTRNIDMPRNDFSRKNNKIAMEGIKAIKTDKVGVENIFSRIRQLFKHFSEQGESQKKQAYQALKADFEAKLRQAVQKQMGTTAGVRIDAESHPQFQEEWRKMLRQMDSQYYNVLSEYKQELEALP